MKLNFDYKGTKITYHLTYKKAKAISINVTESGEVQVTAPRGTSVYAVMDKVKGHAPWIISELYKEAKAQQKNVELLEQYSYLGKNYKLEIVNNSEALVPKVKMLRGKFVVETADSNSERIREAIISWYSEKVKVKLKERLKAYEQAFETVPTVIEVASDDSVLFRASQDTLFANAKIGTFSVEVIDYILVSSLCKINNSSVKNEKEYLEEILPNYQKSKDWLEENKNKTSL